MASNDNTLEDTHVSYLPPQYPFLIFIPSTIPMVRNYVPVRSLLSMTLILPTLVLTSNLAKNPIPSLVPTTMMMMTMIIVAPRQG
jgi:hypothetical protein